MTFAEQVDQYIGARTIERYSQSSTIGNPPVG